MLTRGEDYAHQQPSLTNKKLRQLELTAGAPKHTKASRSGCCVTNADKAIRDAERQLAEQAEISYKRTRARPASWRSGEKSGRERDTGARIN